jgi:hypothetical protein
MLLRPGASLHRAAIVSTRLALLFECRYMAGLPVHPWKARRLHANVPALPFFWARNAQSLIHCA